MFYWFLLRLYFSRGARVTDQNYLVHFVVLSFCLLIPVFGTYKPGGDIDPAKQHNMDTSNSHYEPI